MNDAPKKIIHVEGHRGARSVFPENTLPAFDYALQVGVDVLELDMAVTADKKVVVSHDPYINTALCSRLGKYGPEKLKRRVLIKDLTLEEVKKFDCGLQANPRFPRQKRLEAKIPALQEVFDLVLKSPHPAAKKVLFNIETKVFQDYPEATWDVNTFVEAVLTTLGKYKLNDRIVIQSFDFRTLRRIRELNPKIKLAALTDRGVNPLQALGNLNVEILSPNYTMLNLDLVKEAQARGMKVIPWTVNDPEDWEDMVNLRVDGIISDNPEPLLSFLREKGFHP